MSSIYSRSNNNLKNLEVVHHSMKCSICNEKIETTFLEKIKGAYTKKKGKLKPICPACQRKYTHKQILEKI